MMCLKQTKVFISVLSFFALLSSLLLSIPASADESVVTEVTLSVPISCSLSGTGMNSHTAEVINGRTVSDIGLTTIKAFCNDASGFAIYAIGYTDDTYGKTVLTDSELGSTYDIATSSTVVDATSSWSMKLTSVTGTYAPTIASSFSSYQAVPAHYTKVAYYTASTDTGTSATGSSLNTTYKVHISPTQAAGNYIGQVKYTLIHPNMVDDSNAPVLPLLENDCPTESICYAPNSEDIVGSMEAISSTKLDFSPKAGVQSVTPSSTATLIAPNYSRSGYGFIGWSTDFEADNTSTIYGPNETVSTNPNDGGLDVSAHGVTLYPVWVASSGNMQQWTGCSSLTATTYNSETGKLSLALNKIKALTDTRDGNVYAVAKLADGKCWMIENLRLDAENSREDENIGKAQGYGDATASAQGNLGKFIGLADSENDYFSTSVVANSHYSTSNSNGKININSNSNYSPAYRMPRYNNSNTDRSLNASPSASGSGSTQYQWYGYGNYYNWAAAMANTGYFTSYSDSDATGTSICPKGWRLPLGYSSTGNVSQGASDAANRVGSFSYLDKKMGGTGANQSSTAGTTQSKKWRSFPNNFVYGGYFNTAASGNRNSSGTYWSSSAASDINAYYLGVFNSNVYTAVSGNNKYVGRAIRCISTINLPVLPGN